MFELCRVETSSPAFIVVQILKALIDALRKSLFTFRCLIFCFIVQIDEYMPSTKCNKIQTITCAPCLSLPHLFHLCTFHIMFIP